MQEISKSLLRQRLGARRGPQQHPDADLLTAYTEQSLPPAERAEIILHLSQCNYCREVVALSLPQLQPEQQVQPAWARSRFWIPAFRWGAAFAMVAIVATLLIEKPWKTTPSVPVQTAQVVQPSAVVQPAAATPASPEPPPSPNLTANAAAQSRTTAGVQSAPIAEARQAQRIVSAPPQSPGIVGGTIPNIAAAQPAPQLAVTTAAKPTLAQPPRNSTVEAAETEATRDYVNTNVLRTDNSGSLSANVANVLPSAPMPQGANGQTTASHARFPAIGLDDVASRAMSPNVVPPKTEPEVGSAAGDASLSKSAGFGYKLKSTLSAAVNVVKKGATQRAGIGGFSTRALAGPTARPAANADSPDNTDSEDASTVQGPSQFRIGSDGILMKSTDYTKWHEAYPQGSDLQFKVVLPKGDQVWAGGNNGTLIHSWNAGVDWDKLKVPDSGDITSITVDNGWQVKTSNGQTFVSQDNGKSWVPLEAQPK